VVAIFNLSGKIPKLKEASKMWSNGFLMYCIQCLIKNSGISSQLAEEFCHTLYFIFSDRIYKHGVWTVMYSLL